MAQGNKGQPPAAAVPQSGNGVAGGNPPLAPTVNRKKQKRREKAAAKLAAEQAQNPQPPTSSENGHLPPAQVSTTSKQNPSAQPAPSYAEPDFDDPDQYEGAEEYYSEEDGHDNGESYANGSTHAAGRRKKPRKKKKGGSNAQGDLMLAKHTVAHHLTSTAAGRKGGNKDRIWNTSTSEERERIKEFWLSLGEDERKSLVKIEKEAVLRKMKEQQKHSCSCSVCGRKRTAIEEELEVLYDAYYEELEQYANHQQDGTPMLPPGRYAQMLHSGVPSSRAAMHTHSSSRIHEIDDETSEEEEEEVDEEDYSDDEDDEDYLSEDEEPMELPRGPATDFFNFGNSLTVKGGILTVADDLLKNDGKKFIEMMEQLAERRMQREEEAQFAAQSLGHANMYSKSHAGHNHGPPSPEEDDYDEEEDEDYEDDEEYDEEEEEDEGDTMTEEQRMEEGRRMFQIFAARMFEQRVLTAYREKVAAERQARLLEELAEEDEKKDQREAKKAKEAQKRKEKKEKQKAAKAEAQAKKEAEKAAQEAAAKAAEEKKLEEQRRKREEQRKKKEAERKAQEEERQRKEAERLRRQQEERERQQEAERKAREQKAAEKKAREEAKKKEREEREAREKEAREKKAQEEKERREREAKAKAEKERIRKEEQAAAAAKKAAQPVAVPLPPGLLKQASSQGVPSPMVTPAVPKAPTPNRPRQSSQQGSHMSSPKTPQVAPGTSKSMSPANSLPLNAQGVAPKQILTKPPTSQQPLTMHHPQPSSPMPPIGPPPGMQMPMGMGMANMPPGLNGFSHSQTPMLPGMMGGRPGMPMFPPQPSAQNFRGFPPPGMHGPGAMGMGRGFMEGPPGFGSIMPGVNAAHSMPPFGLGMQGHNRQGSFDKMEAVMGAPPTQPIQRPAPIQRPSSVKPHDDHLRTHGGDIDDLADHLGSKALLDDDDVISELPPASEVRRTSVRAAGFPGTAPLGFDTPRSDSYPFGSVSGPSTTWGTPPMGFSMAGPAAWNSPTTGMFRDPFGPVGGHRRPAQRPALIRQVVCHMCKMLSMRQPTKDGFHDSKDILELAAALRGPTDPTFTQEEMLDVVDVIGDHTNGGGSLEVEQSDSGVRIRFKEGGNNPPTGLGEIGSPLPGHSVPATTGTIGFGGRAFPPIGGVHSPSF